MKRASFTLLFVVMALASAAMSQEKQNIEDKKQAGRAKDLPAVRRLLKNYTAAWAKGDPELLLACYADDAVVIMSHEDPIVGKEALRELYKHVFAAGKTEKEGGGDASMAEAVGLNSDDYTFTTEGDSGKTVVSGDLGYLWSTYATVATPKPGVEGKPIGDSGANVLIVRRQKNGAWKVALAMSTRGADPLAASHQNETAK